METGRTFARVHLVLEIGAGVEFGEERIPHGRESLDLLSQEFALHFQISDIRTQAGVDLFVVVLKSPRQNTTKGPKPQQGHRQRTHFCEAKAPRNKRSSRRIKDTGIVGTDTWRPGQLLVVVNGRTPSMALYFEAITSGSSTGSMPVAALIASNPSDRIALAMFFRTYEP